MARKKKTRKRYSDQERSSILSAAAKEGLTAAAVQKRFGVTPVTYYAWRKKAGASPRRRGRAPVRKGPVLTAGINLVEAVRGELRTQIQRILPDLVRSEVGAALFGGPVRGRRRRRRA